MEKGFHRKRLNDKNNKYMINEVLMSNVIRLNYEKK